MRTRNEPRAAAKGHAFCVDLDGKGKHDFALPPPTRLAPIIERMTAPDMRDVAKASREADDASKAAVLQGSMSALCGLQGALVGACWRHTLLDLDTTWDGKAGGLNDYGVAVFEELWGEGYGLVEIALMWAECQRQISDSFVAQKELLDAMGFLRAPGPASGSTSTSAPSTSAPPSPGAG